MEIKENVLLAIESIKINKMRSVLTMLGIIIGIAAVIAVLSIGNALSNNISGQFADMGASNVFIKVREKSTQYESATPKPKDIMGDGATNTKPIPEQDLLSEDKIRDFVSYFERDIQDISYSETVGSGKAKEGRLYANVNITGVNTGYKEVNSIKMIKGRFINGKDIQAYKNIAVISDKCAENIFGNADPLMQEIKISKSDATYVYSIVGVYRYEASSLPLMGGSASGKDTETDIYIPVTVAKQINNKRNYSMITAMVKPGVEAKDFSSRIDEYFEKYYRNSDYEVAASNMESQLESMQQTLGIVKVAITIIAGISLLVGGIGVMNIMLVSVTERTREIGTRKALGAKKNQIRIQFIFEAAIISLIGGIIGVIIGIMISSLITATMGAPLVVDVIVILGCMLFSMAIGIFFGYYPANKAAGLNPIEALRYE